jgi:transposase
MARPKSVFLNELAEHVYADLENLDEHQIILKLRSILAATQFPVASVAKIFGVAAETIWRWAKTYQKQGVAGLYPKPRNPKPSKLSLCQKAEVLAWIDERRTADGQPVHWTLERLRQAISDKFGVTLGINTIWVWLRHENRMLKVPRPRHNKADEEAHEAFKKTL